MNTRYSILCLLACCTFFTCKKDNIPELYPQEVYTLDQKVDSISFAVIGDFGLEGQNAANVSQLIKSWNPDFIITLGDNNYYNGDFSTFQQNLSQYYCDYIYNPDAPVEHRCPGKATEEKLNRFFPSLGNHDQDGSLDAIPYLNYFSLPGNEVYYDFQWGPVHFFTINSGKDNDHSCCESRQAKWLKQALEQSSKPFKVVYFHHSPYSSSDHGNYAPMQWPFEQWGADAVLTGHNHVYQRITKLSNPAFPYIVNGLGGKSIYACDDYPLDSDYFESFCYNNDYGAMRCYANQDTLTLQFIAVGEPDLVQDEFIIVK